MWFLGNNLSVWLVALVASTVVWLFGGTRGDLLLPVAPWLFAFLIEVIVFFPQRHRTESTYEARARAWASLKSDPVVWLSLGLFALLLVPFLNNGLCAHCDAELIAQGIDPEPSVPFLPFCVNRLDHLNVVVWFGLALAAMVAVRHGLTRRGKRAVLKLIVWNGVAVAVLGFIQVAMDAPGPLWCSPADGAKAGAFFSTFGYPNMGGDFFVTLFGLSVALWRDCYEEDRLLHQQKDVSKLALDDRNAFWRRHFYLIPAAVLFFAALYTLSRAAIMLVTATAVVYFTHALITFLSRMRRVKRVKVGVWSVGIFGMVVFFAMMFMPSDIQHEVDTIGTTEVLDRVTGRGQYHIRVAHELWKDHKLFGCGGWGYSHLCMSKMTEDELKGIQLVGGSNVHNDYMQFLVEHGLVGFGLMVAIALLLVWPVFRGWKALARDVRFKKGKDLPPSPVLVFVLPAPAFIILVTAVATIIHAFGDCPLRSPAVLMLFFISLAAAPGFMPKLEQAPEARHAHHHHHHHSH